MLKGISALMDALEIVSIKSKNTAPKTMDNGISFWLFEPTSILEK